MRAAGLLARACTLDDRWRCVTLLGHAKTPRKCPTTNQASGGKTLAKLLHPKPHGALNLRKRWLPAAAISRISPNAKQHCTMRAPAGPPPPDAGLPDAPPPTAPPPKMKKKKKSKDSLTTGDPTKKKEGPEQEYGTQNAG